MILLTFAAALSLSTQTPAVLAQGFELPKVLRDLIDPPPVRKQAPAKTKPKPVETAAPEASEEVPLPLPRPDEFNEDTATPDVAPDAPQADAETPADEPRAVSPETETAAPETAAPIAEEEPAAEEEEAAAASEGQVETAPAEPERIYQTACPSVISGEVVADMLPPINDGQCVIGSPLSITALSVNGRELPLSAPVTAGCALAGQLAPWAAAIDLYLGAKENTRLATLDVGTGYVCRNRNNAESGPISEHGFGDALDIVGFTLEDGRQVNVESGWGDASSAEGRLLRFAHDAACSRFTTTLGPEANALHRDHLHVDLGCHGKTCTARLCE